MTLGRGHFLLQGHNLNKLGRGQLGDGCYIPNIKALGLMVSDKKIFSCFSYIRLCKTCDPGAGPFLAPGDNLNRLGRGPLGDATYQISKL